MSTPTPPSTGAGTTTGGAATTGGTSVATDMSGRGRGGRGGRWRHRRGGRGLSGRGHHRSSTNRPTSTFQGREEALKGNVYDIISTSTSASSFITTTEEIAEFCELIGMNE
jgi:hypothetical protein